MFKRLLLPTDGSDLSLRAVETGIALAASIGATIYAFHVVAPYPAFSYMMVITEMNEQSYRQGSIERAETCLQEVHQRAEVAGVLCESSYVTDGHPHAAILAAAASYECDLVVMASHGWRGMNHLLLGSETQKVLVSCDVPVLVCR